MNTCENCKHRSKRSMECCYKPPTTIRYQLGYIGTDYFPSVHVEPDWTCDAWTEDQP